MLQCVLVLRWSGRQKYYSFFVTWFVSIMQFFVLHTFEKLWKLLLELALQVITVIQVLFYTDICDLYDDNRDSSLNLALHTF